MMSQEQFLMYHWTYWLAQAIDALYEGRLTNCDQCFGMADRYYSALQELRNGSSKVVQEGG
jgi:NMD protein affecting ribosome stability and mRNA decay